MKKKILGGLLGLCMLAMTLRAGSLWAAQPQHGRILDRLDEMLNAWIEKQTTKIPKAPKKGMTFKDYKLNRIYEVLSDEKKSSNPNLSGDAADFVECKWTDFKTGKTGGAYSVSRQDLSAAKHVKFLRA